MLIQPLEALEDLKKIDMGTGGLDFNSNWLKQVPFISVKSTVLVRVLRWKKISCFFLEDRGK